MDRQYSRRQVVQGAGAVGLVLLAGCGRLPWQAPHQPRIPRMGYLEVTASTNAETQKQINVFEGCLVELGWLAGQNLQIEYRFADEQFERLATLADELVQLPVDVLVAVGAGTTRVAKNATSTIPIVMLLGSDPVGLGLIASLGRPGGNVTGLSQIAVELIGNRLEMLQAVVPNASLVGFLWNAALAGRGGELQLTERDAHALGLQVRELDVRAAEEFEAAFEIAVRDQVQAVLVQNNFLANAHKGRIADLALRSRLPTISALTDYPATGGLMAYGPNQAAHFRQGAVYVDKILKGAKPADLPVEQPREFEFVINLRTAQALGLTIPPHVLLQTTEVIQ
jgi:putative tryptophan/tyrosine transport system substrate-binding protein